MPDKNKFYEVLFLIKFVIWINFRFKTIINDQLFHDQQSDSKQDGSSECLDQSLDDLSSSSFELNKSLCPQKVTCTVNNIYIIGDINASIVKLGESSFEKVLTSTKNQACLYDDDSISSTQSDNDSTDMRFPMSRMPEYFDKVKNSDKQKMIFNDHYGIERTTDITMRATCHCHSITKK